MKSSNLEYIFHTFLQFLGQVVSIVLHHYTNQKLDGEYEINHCCENLTNTTCDD